MAIKEAMTRQGLNQANLAKRLGISPPALSQLLTGKRGTIPESLMDVIHALGLSLEVVPLRQGQEDKQ